VFLKRWSAHVGVAVHLRSAYATRLKYLRNSVLSYSWSIEPNTCKYPVFKS